MVFAGKGSGVSLCMEVGAVVVIDDVMRDEKLGEPPLADFGLPTPTPLAVLDRSACSDAGLPDFGLGMVGDAMFVDSMQCL